MNDLGSSLRQAFVDRFGHCSFTQAEYVAGIAALRHRVESGRWDSVAQPQALQASAGTLGLGDTAFVHFEPPALRRQRLVRPGEKRTLTSSAQPPSSGPMRGSRAIGCPPERCAGCATMRR